MCSCKSLHSSWEGLEPNMSQLHSLRSILQSWPQCYRLNQSVCVSTNSHDMTKQICHARQKWKEQDVTLKWQFKWDQQWEIILIAEKNIASSNRKKSHTIQEEVITPTLTTEVHCSRYYKLLLWRLKWLPWIWMRGRRGTWVFSGVCAVFRMRV